MGLHRGPVARGARTGLVRRLIAGACLSLACTACTHRIPFAPPAPPPPSTACRGPEDLYQWRWAESPRPELDRWCGTVGAPVVALRPPADTAPARLLIVSWNVHVGAGDVESMVAALRATEAAEGRGEPALVLLLQETYRSGGPVPAQVEPGVSVPGAIVPRPRTADVAALAVRLGFSLAYVPSMRNGRMGDGGVPEDRGSAILSSEPLTRITAIELPFGRRRRTAVMAVVTPRDAGVRPLVVVSAHLDAWWPRVAQADALLRALAQEEGRPLVLGIDTNATFGRRDGVVRRLGRTLRQERCGRRRTGPWVARLDFVFSTLPDDVTRTCGTGRDDFGSDHRPLVLALPRW